MIQQKQCSFLHCQLLRMARVHQHKVVRYLSGGLQRPPNLGTFKGTCFSLFHSAPWSTIGIRLWSTLPLSLKVAFLSVPWYPKNTLNLYSSGSWEKLEILLSPLVLEPSSILLVFPLHFSKILAIIGPEFHPVFGMPQPMLVLFCRTTFL